MRFSFACGLILLLAACSTGQSVAAKKPVNTKNNFRVTYVINETFDIAKDNVKEALSDKGLKINTIAHISTMLKRTGKSLGNPSNIYTAAENIEFCSAIVSRATMQANPHNIVYCPYIISIYSLKSNPKITYISYRRVPNLKDKKSHKALQAVEKLLDDIAKTASES
ncbi:hypothetical protein MNBD_GAMMA12-1873 [hydrothermal vent metagenome]|uniref:DUF302 domain-containing protein n=1 Tax=hydrothermal vent metagenome TaxID=652676 RepID=A0A3B0ZQG0_9ZZZZ